MSQSSYIFLDNAATTPLRPEVAEAMMPYLSGYTGNASSIHRSGRQARLAVERAREQVAEALNVVPKTLIFTSGGTESNHAALVGAYLGANQDARQAHRPHIVVSAVEHHAVLETVEWLHHHFGAQVTVVPPDAEGRIHPDDVVAAVTPGTCLIAVMGVNNELGTIEPISAIVERIRALNAGIHIHSDMVQALGAMSLDLGQIGVDSAAISAHKIHGPQGMGALYLRDGSNWVHVQTGGRQERNRRAGTENVAGIVGFGAAAQLGATGSEQRTTRVRQLRDRLWDGLSSIPNCVRNSPIAGVAPGILNVSFLGIRSDAMLAYLDLAGIAASAGSACTAGVLEPSHVLLACGRSEQEASECIRFSISDLNTGSDIDATVAAVRQRLAAT